MTTLPLARGARGDGVRDIQRRLASLGFDPGDPPARYGTGTERAVRRFQDERGITVDGVCGDQTWRALVEAGHRLGDRLLYERRPMLRGDDVADLQTRLSRLGFDPTWIDGIFGPLTTSALVDFQRNAGLTTDAICGPETIQTLLRMGGRTGPETKATVHEREALRHARRDLAGRRVLVGESGGLAAVAEAVERTLRDAGAVVAVTHHPDPSERASEANAFHAEVYVGLAVADDGALRTTYYATEGFESVGGRQLAGLLVDELSPVIGREGASTGRRLAVLRETRMPAVQCELGDTALVVSHAAELSRAVGQAVIRWASHPIDDDSA